MYTDPSGNTPIPLYCLAAFGLAVIDGPLPFGEATLFYCLMATGAILGGGAVTLNYVANAPAPSGMIPVRERVKIIPLEEILRGCWIEFRPKYNPTPESIPTIDPFPIQVTPFVSTPQPTPTRKPEKTIVDLGSGTYGYWARTLKATNPEARVIASDKYNYYPLKASLQGSGVEVVDDWANIQSGIANYTWAVAPQPMSMTEEGKQGLRITKPGGVFSMIFILDELGIHQFSCHYQNLGLIYEVKKLIQRIMFGMSRQ
jgi:hypothetical protein